MVLILSVAVNGAWWVPILKPVVLSFGAALAAVNIDVAPLRDINLFSHWKDKDV